MNYGLELPFNIVVKNPTSNIDERYGVHPDIATALAATVGTRKKGLTLGVEEAGKTVEYWFETNDISDAGLVKKTVSGGGTNTDFLTQIDLSSTAQANPGAGKIRFNNANPAAATAIYLNETEYNNGSLAMLVDNMASLTVTLRSITDRTKWYKFNVTSVIRQAGGYCTMAGNSPDNGTPFASNDIVAIKFDKWVSIVEKNNWNAKLDTTVKNDTDLNTVTESGFHTINRVLATNAPDGIARAMFGVLVMNYMYGTNIVQIAFDSLTPGDMWIRERHWNAGYVWSSWVKTYNSGTYSALITQDKTIIGSINEVATALIPLSPINGIISANLVANNSYIDVLFATDIYGDIYKSKGVFCSDFSLTFTKNAGTALNVEIIDATRLDNSFLVGGEKNIRFHLYVDGIASGVETIEIKPITAKVFNNLGVAFLNTITTGVKNINAENIDFLSRYKNLDLYLDLSDNSYLTSSVLKSKDNNGFQFMQSVVGNQPTVLTGYVTFADTKTVVSKNPVYLASSGYSIFFVLQRTVNGDDIVISSLDTLTLGNIGWLGYVMIRATTVLVNVIGGTGPAFTYSVGTTKKILEIRFLGGTSWELYDNNVLVATASTGSSASCFNQIGASGQGLDANMYNISVFNSTDSTRRTNLYNRLYSKYIGATTTVQTIRPIYNPIILGFSLRGQSNAVGRCRTSQLSAKNANYNAIIPNTYIFPKMDSSLIMDSPYNPNDVHAGETYADSFGSELPILYRLREIYGRAFVLKQAQGGSSLATSVGGDWNKTAMENYKFAVLFDWANNQILRGLMFNPINLGVVWLQGEEDATIEANSLAYQANYIQFKSDIRADTTQPLLSFVSADIISSAYKDNVNSAFRGAVALDGNSYHDSITKQLTTFDAVHYDADSMITLGNTLFQKYFKDIIAWRLLIK